MGLDFSAAATHYADLADGVDNANAFSLIMWAMKTNAAGTAARGLTFKGNFTKYTESPANNRLFLRVQRATTHATANSNDNVITPNVPFCVCFTFDETDGPRIFVRTLTVPFAEVTYFVRDTGAGASVSDSASGWRFGASDLPGYGWQGHQYFAHHIARRLTSTTEMDTLAMELVLDASSSFLVRMGLSGATAFDVGPSTFAVSVVGATQSANIAVPQKSIGGSIAPAASLVRDTGKLLAGGLAPSAALSRATAKVFAGALPLSGTLSGSKAAQVSLSGTIAPSASLSRSVAHALSGTLGVAGSLGKGSGKTLAGVLAMAGALTRNLLSGGVSVVRYITGELSLRPLVTGRVGWRPVVTAARVSMRPVVTGTVGQGPAIVAGAAGTFTGSIAPSGALSRAVMRAVAGTVGPSGIVRRLASRALSGSLGVSGALSTSRVTFQSLSGSVGMSGALGTLLVPGAGDGIAALIAALQADSGVPAYWDGRFNVTDIAGEADRWAVSHEDSPGVPDLVATSAAARPTYDGAGLTFNGVDTRMVTIAAAALNVLSAGGSLLMLGSLSTINNTLNAAVRNASGRFIELARVGTSSSVLVLNSGGTTIVTIAGTPTGTRLALSAAYDPATAGAEAVGRAMNLARVSMARTGTIAAENAWVELGARNGALFGTGVINAIALLDAPFTPAQMTAWRDFGVAQFGISTL